MPNGDYKSVLKAYENYLIDGNHVSKATLSAYKTDINKFFKYVIEKYGINDFSDLNVSMITSYLLFMKQNGQKSSSVARSLSSLKRLMLFAYHEQYTSENLSEIKIDIPKNDKKVPEILTVDEIDVLLSQPDASILGIRDRAMLETLYTSGLKVNELINLRLKDIDLKLKVLKVYSKNKVRVLPLGAIAIEAIESYLKKSRKTLSDGTCDFLFLSYNGSAISRQGFWKLVKKYARQAGIAKNISTSTFRHSFASHMIENGLEKDTLRETLGNASVASVQVYLDINRKRRRL